jgi:hypothetical protein
MTTKELSATGTASLTSPIQLGAKRSIQEDQYWKPIQWKFLLGPDAEDGHFTALWEFCCMEKSDSFFLPDELLTRADFRVSNEPWPSISITIACYYSQQQATLSLRKARGVKVGWRDFCHSTRIVMPVMEWAKHEEIYRLHLPITVDPTEVAEKSYTEGEAHKLIFRTSAECKAHPCTNRGHGRGPQKNST